MSALDNLFSKNPYCWSNKISIEEIVSLAALQRKIDLASLDNDVFPSDMDAFKKGLDRLNGAELMMLMIAGKFLEGKPYSITSDNPETINRCRSLAEHMGASVDEICKGNGLTQITFGPPSRQ